MKVFWSLLVMGDLISFLLFVLNRCDCGAPGFFEMFVKFAPWAGIFALVFAIISLPVGLAWWAIHRKWNGWRPLSVPKLMLASALIGISAYGLLDHKLGVEEQAQATAESR